MRSDLVGMIEDPAGSRFPLSVRAKQLLWPRYGTSARKARSPLHHLARGSCYQPKWCTGSAPDLSFLGLGIDSPLRRIGVPGLVIFS